MEEDIKIAWQMCAHRKKLAGDKKWEEREYNHKLNDFEKYLDFIKKFPTVSRHLIEFGDYEERAFRMYVTGIIKKPVNNPMDWASHEARYVKYLAKILDPGKSSSDLRKIWRETRDLLHGEAVGFKEKNAEAKEIAEKETEMVSRETKKDLLAIAQSDPAVMARLIAAYKARGVTHASPP